MMPGVVDEHVDAPVALDRLATRVRRRRLPHVGDHGQDFANGWRCRCRPPRALSSSSSRATSVSPGALVRELARHDQAEPARPSGDDHRLAGEVVGATSAPGLRQHHGAEPAAPSTTAFFCSLRHCINAVPLMTALATRVPRTLGWIFAFFTLQCVPSCCRRVARIQCSGPERCSRLSIG